MANDKLALQCACGGWLTMGRWLGDVEVVAETDQIEAFLNEHIQIGRCSDAAPR